MMHKFMLTGGWSGDSSHELHLLQREQDFSPACLPVPDAFNPQIQRTLLSRGINYCQIYLNLEINAQDAQHVIFVFFKNIFSLPWIQSLKPAKVSFIWLIFIWYCIFSKHIEEHLIKACSFISSYQIYCKLYLIGFRWNTR